MKVFVTGGTGFVGREILRQLQDAGHSIRRRPDDEEVRNLACRHQPELVAAPLDTMMRIIDALMHENDDPN